MAITEASDLFIPEVSLEYARQAFVDSLEVMGKLVGEGADAPVRVMNDAAFSSMGQFLQGPVFKRISGLVTKRDVTSTSAVTPLELTGDNAVAAKMHRKIGPVEYTLDAARISRAGREQISAEIGRQAGEQMSASIQASILAALLGTVDTLANSAHTHSVWDASTRVNLSPSVLNLGLNKMGDRRRAISSWIMRSEPFADLIESNIQAGISGVADRVLDGGEPMTFRMPVALLDDARLTIADAGADKYITLGAGAGALELFFTLPLTIYPPFLETGTEQVKIRWRADFDFALRAPGFAWDTGTPNPADNDLAASGNWTIAHTSHKEVPVVKIVHNYSGN
ncbi:MAG: major capsid protein [Planctomycetes bacterium]|nr:major capsid protein [Planctomycetota bacterium]